MSRGAGGNRRQGVRTLRSGTQRNARLRAEFFQGGIRIGDIGRIGDDEVETLTAYGRKPRARAPLDTREPEACALRMAISNAGAETSMPTIRACGRSEAMASAMAPLPVPKSSTDAHEPAATAAKRARRGVRFPAEARERRRDLQGSDQNSRVPSNKQPARLRAPIDQRGVSALGFGCDRLVAARREPGARQIEDFPEQQLGVEPRRFAEAIETAGTALQVFGDRAHST